MVGHLQINQGNKMKTLESVIAGDTVLILRPVKTGALEQVAFWVNVRVERVTKTQIITNGQRFYKADGREVGAGFGPGCVPAGTRPDETIERRQCVALVRKSLNVRRTGDTLRTPIRHDHPHLSEIAALTDQIDALIDLCADGAAG